MQKTTLASAMSPQSLERLTKIRNKLISEEHKAEKRKKEINSMYNRFTQKQSKK